MTRRCRRCFAARRKASVICQGLTQIRHEKASDQSLIFQLDYAYSPDGLVDGIEESQAGVSGFWG